MGARSVSPSVMLYFVAMSAGGAGATQASAESQLMPAQRLSAEIKQISSSYSMIATIDEAGCTTVVPG